MISSTPFGLPVFAFNILRDAGCITVANKAIARFENWPGGSLSEIEMLQHLPIRQVFQGAQSSGGCYLVLSRMATLPYSSMGMARSGAWSLLKSPEAMEKPPWWSMAVVISMPGPNFPLPLP